MNEIKKCSIAGVSFTLERDAYETLSQYLQSLRDTYCDDPDGEEILADIEARIAELILSTQPLDAIIAKPLINNIIKQMGSAAEIDEEGTERHVETEDQYGNPRIPRRLYRDLENGKLGGVCAGIASYFDIDPAWVRLAAFLPLLLTPIIGSMNFLNALLPLTSNLFGFVVLGYLIMWFAIPAASSARQRLEMRGERITADSIRANTTAPDQRERTIIAQLVAAFGSFLLICVKIVTLLILIVLVCGSSVLGLVAITGVPALLTTDFVTGVALASFFVVVTIPIIVLIYLSVMLLISRRPHGRTMLIMFIIWLIALIAMIVSAIKSPVKFDRQIENTFESVFEHDEDILFEEFTEEEFKEFHEQFEDYDTTSLQQDNLTLTLEGPSDNISQMKATVQFGDDGLRITDNKGELIEITTDGIKVGGEDFINYTTERSPQSDAIIFSVGGVTIRLEEAIKSAEEE
ncbi:MAG: PspC domain-containing protein [Alistipes sp.]|nr:PspC domain-containing protein [Alistipes sp.]